MTEPAGPTQAMDGMAIEPLAEKVPKEPMVELSTDIARPVALLVCQVRVGVTA
jgi:hypothetical protein